MATAISYESESGDAYLSLYVNGETIEEIIDKEKKEYGMEFSYLYVEKCKSTDHDSKEVVAKIVEAIECFGDC